MNSANKKIKKKFFRPENLLIIFGTLLIVIPLIIIFTNNNNNNEKPTNANSNQTANETKPIPKYQLNIHLDFIDNLIFSRYDVNLTLGEETTMLSHGKNKDLTYFLVAGNYTIDFSKVDDATINYQEQIQIQNDTNITYRITCHNDRIKVEKIAYEEVNAQNPTKAKIQLGFDQLTYWSKNYKEVKNKLEEKGFTNIETKATYDLTLYGLENYTFNEDITKIKVNGTTDYSADNIFDHDVKIVIYYHARDIDDPSRLTPPYDTESAQNLNYEVVVQAFKTAGFTNIEAKESSGSGESYTVSSIRISSLPADKTATYKADEKVTIFYYEPN